MDTNQFKSEKSGDLVPYLRIKDLPTGFRSYPDKHEVYIRGLYFEEILSLSRFIGFTPESAVDYGQLVAIYSDCVRGIDIKCLEPIDLRILMIISSIWTIEDFGWIPNVPCTHIVNEEPCGGKVEEKVILDDFDFEKPLITKLPIPVMIKGEEYQIGALTVGDKLEKENYLKSNPDVDPTLVDYAVLIKNPDLTLDQKVKVVRYGDRGVLQIKQVDSDLKIKVKPILKRCSKCMQYNKVYIGLDKVKAYP